MCDFFWADVNTHLFIPDKELLTDLKDDGPKYRLVRDWLVYRNMVRGYLANPKAAKSSSAHPSMDEHLEGGIL